MKATARSRQKSVIPVFFAVDDRYTPFLLVALRSMIDNASKKYDYRVSVLIHELSDESRAMISSVACENVTVEFVNVAEKLDSFGRMLHLRDYYSKATYYRFFIPSLFPQYKRCIYLDCDIAVFGDISALWRAPLGNRLVGAVADDVVLGHPVFSRYTRDVLNIPDRDYFNAGVLLLNLAEMRKIRMEERLAAFLRVRQFPVAQDQDYLNVFCHGRVLYLDRCWNRTAFPANKGEKLPMLAHFKINCKPWHYSGIAYEAEFWHYAAKTPAYREICRIRENYSAADRVRDAEQYEHLLSLARAEIEAALPQTRSACADSGVRLAARA